jgi:hypothetical protein
LAALNAWGQRATDRRAAAEEVRRRRFEHRKQQLTELYGPLRLLRGQSSYLARKLREGKADPESWHILDHVQEVLDSPVDGPIAQMILEINAEVEHLLVHNGGLVYTPTPPQSWELFLGHCRLLRMALSGGAIPPVNEFSYFPPSFDPDMERAYTALRCEVDAMMSEAKQK